MATQTSKQHVFSTISIALACIMAAYSARLGYATTTSDVFLSGGIALACGFFVFAICEFFVMALPRMDNARRAMCGCLALVIMPLMFYFSTQWTVVAIGGKTAMSSHIQTTIVSADKAALDIYRQLTAEKNMAPQLKSLATQYAELAGREKDGAFSGSKGEGDVVATLRSTSNLFLNAANTIEGVADKGDDLYAEYQKYSDTARKIQADLSGTEVTNGPEVRKLLLKFGGNLSDINRVLTRMRGTSAVEYVKTMNKNLGQLAMNPTDKSTQAQRDAIDHLKTTVSAAQAVVTQITSTGGVADDSNQNFAMMEPAEAIWAYAGKVGFAWGAGIALDLFPFIWAFCSLLTAKEAKEDKEEAEDAEKEALRRTQPRRVDRVG